jgi:hypothetical protein
MPTNPGSSQCSAAETQSEAGAHWPKELNAMPKNADRKIAAFQILDILGYNPSYIEPCELTGLKLDRARFGVTLLAALPAANATPAQPAESRVPQTLNKLATPKEYQSVNYWLL